MASPVDIASIFKRKGQTPTPETQAPSQGPSIIRSFFVREGGTEATPAPQRPNPVLSYFDPVAYSRQQAAANSQQRAAANNKSQGVEEIAPKAEVKELTEEEKRNVEQRNKNKAFASGRPATIFSQPESSNIKIKKHTLGAGS